MYCKYCYHLHICPYGRQLIYNQYVRKFYKRQYREFQDGEIGQTPEVQEEAPIPTDDENTFELNETPTTEPPPVELTEANKPYFLTVGTIRKSISNCRGRWTAIFLQEPRLVLGEMRKQFYLYVTLLTGKGDKGEIGGYVGRGLNKEFFATKVSNVDTISCPIRDYSSCSNITSEDENLTEDESKIGGTAATMRSPCPCSYYCATPSFDYRQEKYYNLPMSLQQPSSNIPPPTNIAPSINLPPFLTPTPIPSPAPSGSTVQSVDDIRKILYYCEGETVFLTLKVGRRGKFNVYKYHKDDDSVSGLAASGARNIPIDKIFSVIPCYVLKKTVFSGGLIDTGDIGIASGTIPGGEEGFPPEEGGFPSEDGFPPEEEGGPMV